MERIEDIYELLDSVQDNINSIKNKYKQAKKDEEVKTVLKPLVKSTLEHLRSILEYSIQDICDFHNIKKEKVYFPYGEEKYFKKNIKNNFHFLKNTKIYSLIESLQSFKAKDKWLVELCNQTNFNKHNKLRNQKRTNSTNSRTNIGNLISMDNSSSVTLKNVTLNGVTIAKDKEVTINGNMSKKDVSNIVDNKIKVEKEFEFVEFRFDDTLIDVLELIENSHLNIKNYIDKLEKIIQS